MTPAEVLNGAAEIIARDGLVKGRFHDGYVDGYRPGVACCALGAMYVVAGFYALEGSGDWQQDAFVKASSALCSVADTDHIGVWNDAAGRTADEVVAKLREAAAAVSS